MWRWRGRGARLALALAMLGIGCGGDDSGAVDAGANAGTAGQGASGGRGVTGDSAAGASAAGVGSAGTGSVAGGSGGVGGSVDAGLDTGPGTDGDAGTEPFDDTPRVRFVGRPDRRDPDAVRLAWSGSGILFRFTGTEASILLDDAAGFFSVVIDGEEEPVLETTPGERSYQLASGLASGDHEVALYRRTEALFGVTRYFDVDLGADGVLLAPPRPPARSIELIGDSITCGYGNEGPDMSCPFEARTENHYLTYGAITARELGAELVTIAWSGKGIVYNYGDDKVEPLPELYPRALPQDGSSQWDFAEYQPDVVVINLGTNDFSTDDDPSEAVFGDAYRAFLQKLRAHYPQAFIVCLVPTLLDGADKTTAQDYIAGVVADLSAAGDDRLAMAALEFETSGWGCDWHPSLQTHASMATALTAELRALMGW